MELFFFVKWDFMKILIALPVYNEEKQLSKNVNKLYSFLEKSLPYSFQIVIADNNSTDGTGKIGKDLEKSYKNIKYLYLPKKGKGLAIKQAWQNKDFDIYSFMDIDLSTDLSAFPILINKIVKEDYDVAIGSRLSKESKVKRGFKRTFVSKSYNLLLKLFFNVSFPDAQCGFKAIKRSVFEQLSPEIKNDGFFFDTELLLLAEKKYKFKICSVPVNWADDTTSTVHIGKTIKEDLSGLWRMYWYLRKNKR